MSPLETARNSGYSDEEIFEFFSSHPDYKEKIAKAKEAGYEDEEIISFIGESESEDISPQEERKQHFIQNIASSSPAQFVLGGIKKLSWPLDALQAAGLAEGISSVDEIEEVYRKEGLPFNRDDYLAKVYQAASVMPTQDLAEEYIKKTTGLDLAPQSQGGKIARKTGEILTLSNPNLLKEGGKSALKKSAAAGTGATVAQGLQELGVPELFADIAGYGLAGAAAAGKKVPQKLTPEGKALSKTAEKHNLPQYAGMDRSKSPKNPVVSKQKQVRLRDELSTSSKNAIDEIVEGELPIKKLKEKGYDLEEAYTELYDRAESLAEKFDKQDSLPKKGGKSEPKGVDIKPLLKFIRKKIKQIENSAPSLSKPDKVQLKILKDEYKALTKNPKPVNEAAVKLVDAQGNPFPSSKGKKGRQPKIVSATQAIDQKRNWNENVRDLYRKTEFTGAENEVRKTYAELGEKLVESLEKSGDPKLAESLKFGDRIFTELQKLRQVEEIMSEAFEGGYNPKKLTRLLNNKRTRSHLKRDLGPQAVKELKAIATYGEAAHTKVLDKLNSPKTVGEWAAELTPTKAALLFIRHGLLPGAAASYDIGKGVSNRVQGLLFTRKSTRKAYEGFLKGARTGSISSFKKASQTLSKAIADEFGSEKDLLKMAKDLENSEDE